MKKGGKTLNPQKKYMEEKKKEGITKKLQGAVSSNVKKTFSKKKGSGGLSNLQKKISRDRVDPLLR